MPERTCDKGMIGSPAAAEDAGSSSAATVRAIRRARMDRAMYPRSRRIPAVSSGERRLREEIDPGGAPTPRVCRHHAGRGNGVAASPRSYVEPLADRVVRDAVPPADGHEARRLDLPYELRV